MVKMKYIRTTNGIYKSNSSNITKITQIEENGEEYPCLEINLGYSTDGYIITRNERIIKESGNLEKLCDEFRYGLRKNGVNIFGAIWTDKGLIYVAARRYDEKRFELL